MEKHKIVGFLMAVAALFAGMMLLYFVINNYDEKKNFINTVAKNDVVASKLVDGAKVTGVICDEENGVVQITCDGKKYIVDTTDCCNAFSGNGIQVNFKKSVTADKSRLTPEPVSITENNYVLTVPDDIVTQGNNLVIYPDEIRFIDNNWFALTVISVFIIVAGLPLGGLIASY